MYYENEYDEIGVFSKLDASDISWNDLTFEDKTNHDQKEISVMSWNIDGLCDRGLLARLDAVISEIKRINPNVVMLQEVVDEHVTKLRSELGLMYDITFGDRTTEYYNAMLIDNGAKKLRILQKQSNKFPGSVMGRHYVQVDCEMYDRRFSFYTSHLESTKKFSSERKRQLDEVMQEIRSGDSELITIFGGDMNLRDSEKRIYPRRSAPLTDNVYDVWEKLGSDSNTEFTWDTSVNTNLQVDFIAQHRFDRIFVRDSPYCTPITLSTFGKTLLQSCDMYPSDHWGILAYFIIS